MDIRARRVCLTRALPAVVVLYLGLAGAGCFSDPVNRPPRISSIMARNLPIVRGEPAWFTATVSDPDTDQRPIVPTWAYVPGDCPPDTGAANRPPSAAPPALSATEEFMVSADVTHGPFCVWAFATDRYGAVDVKNLQVQPHDREPNARIAVVHPDCGNPDPGAPGGCKYPLYSDFWLSGASSSDPDGDPLSDYAWTLDSVPTGSGAALAPCPLGGPDTACFSADVPGQYKVSLSVRALEAHGTSTVTLSVGEDQLPCISISRPDYLSMLLVHDPMMQESFIVDRVDDDGDPYPRSAHGETHFTWYVGHAGEPLVYQDNDFHSLDLAPGTFSLGDVGSVRVEIHDRNTRAIDNVLLGCGNDDLCAARSGCFQRVSWKIEYLR